MELERISSPGRWLAVAVSTLVALSLVVGCARTQPEQALRESVTRLQQSVEQRDSDALEAVIAEDFLGPEGMDRAAARRLAQLMFLRYQDLACSWDRCKSI